MSTDNPLPIVVIGAGPVGLAAAAELLAKGETPVVIEAGSSVGASVLSWGHVGLFSPWRYCVDPAARALLEENGWTAPNGESWPTGRELVERYLEPLYQLPQVKPLVRLNTRVVSVTRKGMDKLKTIGREQAPFSVTVTGANGEEEVVLARAVIDASGTYSSPNPLGSGGVFAVGERAVADRIAYRIPDVLGSERARYEGRTVAVVGSGHSAFNALLELIDLQAEAPATKVHWVVRKNDVRNLFGGGDGDQLEARGALGAKVKRLLESGALNLHTGFRIETLRRSGDRVELVNDFGEELPPVDEVIATTGFRPDLSMLSEVRIGLDPGVEAPTELAPLIDPNFHSCGTVRPHGALELAHPEKDFYIAGMKSYGRAPTFLLLTGYEQVRSIACALTGDMEGAAEVKLELPETGVCSIGDGPGGGCCETVPAIKAPTVANGLALLSLSERKAAPPSSGCCGGGS